MVRTILAVDPGPAESGYVLFGDGYIHEHGNLTNGELLSTLRILGDRAEGIELVIEMIEGRGMAVGQDVFETCVWVGRFVQRWLDAGGSEPALVYRRKVKLHLCGDSRAKDGNVAQAVRDRLGPKGTKRAPGPTFGISGHRWQALALAVTALETLAAPNGRG